MASSNNIESNVDDNNDARLRDDVVFDSLANFRRIRGTRVFRSSAPDSLTLADVARLKQMGVKTIIDFRSPGTFEKDLKKEKLIDRFYRPYITTFNSDGTYAFQPQELEPGNQKLDIAPADNTGYLGNHYYVSLIDKEFAMAVGSLVPWYHRIRLVFWAAMYYAFGVERLIKEVSTCALNPIGIVGMYNHFVADSRNRVAASLEMIGNRDNLPVVICCRHGKDRTGVLSALIHGVMGRDREEIVRDYAKTKEYSEELRESLKEYDDYFGFTEEFATAEPETMEKVLDFIEERYGSILGYLEYIGFKGEKLEEFKNSILE